MRITDINRLTDINRPEVFRTVARARVIAWRDHLGFHAFARRLGAASAGGIVAPVPLTHTPDTGVNRLRILDVHQKIRGAAQLYRPLPAIPERG